MAFTDSVTQSLANGGSAPDVQAQTGRPDDATMPQSAVPPAPSAAAGAPTTPAQPPQQEPQPPALIHPHHRSFFGAVASALVGGTLAAASQTTKAVAGPQPPQYTTDANGRVIRDPNQKPDTTSSRLQRIALAALEGLAAGSRVPPQRNKAAAWASGIGAGAENEIQRGREQDLIKREQAKEQFEAQQKALTNRATIWAHNMERYREWLQAAKLEADMNPEYQLTQVWKDSIDQYNADNPGAPHDYKIVSPEQAQTFLLPQQQGAPRRPRNYRALPPLSVFSTPSVCHLRH